MEKIELLVWSIILIAKNVEQLFNECYWNKFLINYPKNITQNNLTQILALKINNEMNLIS